MKHTSETTTWDFVIFVKGKEHFIPFNKQRVHTWECLCLCLPACSVHMPQLTLYYSACTTHENIIDHILHTGKKDKFNAWYVVLRRACVCVCVCVHRMCNRKNERGIQSIFVLLLLLLVHSFIRSLFRVLFFRLSSLWFFFFWFLSRSASRLHSVCVYPYIACIYWLE